MELTFTSENATWANPKINFKTCVKEFLDFIENPNYVNLNSTMMLHEKVSYIKQLLKFKVLLLIVIVPILIYTNVQQNHSCVFDLVSRLLDSQIYCFRK